MQLVRRPDWEQRLVELVRTRRTTPYRYGVNDCATFAQDAVEAVTGMVLLPGAERPKGWLGAAKFLIAHDWVDVEEMATALLGSPKAPHVSRRGDIVSYGDDDEFHLAVR